MKIWTGGSSPQSGSRNAWTHVKNVNGASRLSNFWNFFGTIQMILCRARLVTMDENWLCHYDPETNQHSMEWRHCSSPHPKKFRVQKSAGKFSPRFGGIKTASASLIIFQRAKLSRRSITHLCWCNWRTFWRKTPREGHQGDLVLARHCPGSPGTCNPEETGLPGLPVSWSPTLFSGSGPVGLPPFPGLKKELKVRHFSSDAAVNSATETWLDGQLSEFFLSGVQKLEQWAKKCIELRGQCVE